MDAQQSNQPSPLQRDPNTCMRRKLLDIQTRRREQVLERQRSNRQAKLDKARHAALHTLLEGGTPTQVGENQRIGDGGVVHRQVLCREGHGHIMIGE